MVVRPNALTATVSRCLDRFAAAGLTVHVDEKGLYDRALIGGTL